MYEEQDTATLIIDKEQKNHMGNLAMNDLDMK